MKGLLSIDNSADMMAFPDSRHYKFSSVLSRTPSIWID